MSPTRHQKFAQPRRPRHYEHSRTFARVALPTFATFEATAKPHHTVRFVKFASELILFGGPIDAPIRRFGQIHPAALSCVPQ
jgi:hypothetical protein